MMKLRGRRGRALRLAAVLLAGGALAVGTVTAAGPLQAQMARSIAFSIPAGPLNQALTAFGRQAGLQVTYLSTIGAGKTSPGFSGEASAEQALAALLHGTGLAYSFTNATTVAISDPGSSASGGTMTLSPVEVTVPAAGAASGSGYLGTPDWVYESPSGLSVISREAVVDSPVRNARDLLDAVAGVYANRSEAQNPGISVNIRGLQDQDRIVMMIDGARQSFQRSGHGATQRTFVDTAFLRTVDIEKASTAGVGSLGSLGGAVNFRTLEASDIIPLGDTWGAEMNLTTGTNEYNFEGSLVASVRLTDTIAVTGGISRRDIGAYEIGRNGEVRQGTTYDSDILLFSGQEVFGTFLKIEAELFEDVTVTLGWLRNESTFSTGSYDNLIAQGGISKDLQFALNNTLTASLDWTPGSDWIDLKARFYFNHIDNKDSAVIERPSETLLGTPTNFTMGTLGGSLENTTRFDTGFGLLSFNYGGEAFHDDGEAKVPSGMVSGGGASYANALTGGNPDGKRTVAGGFLNATFEHDDWLLLSAGLRYDWYRISGNVEIYGNRTRDIVGYEFVPGTPPSCWPSPPFPPNYNCTPGTPDTMVPVYGDYYYPRHEVDVDRSGEALLPSFTIAVKPFPWLQPFVGYAQSFRPPTVMESFLNSGHAGVINGYAPNPDLQPESGETWELGVNLLADGVLRDGDALRLKAVGFYREIEDYIAMGRIDYAETDRRYTAYVNLDGKTRMRGVEIEASYDARTWYLGGGFTWNEADYPKWYKLPAGSGLGYLGPETSVIFVQPARRLALDGGVRLFDENLTLGARMTSVSASKPTLGTLAETGNYSIDGYVVFDVYASYVFNENVKLRAAVTNLTDEAYISATGVNYYAAPGATATISLQVKF